MTTLTAEPDRVAAERRRGAVAMLPILTGYVPFGVLVGAAAASSPDPLAGGVATLLLFGGSAQLTVSHLLTEGAALATIVVTGLLIQSRLVVYSASLAPHWQDRPRWWRAVAAATVIDPSWAVAEARHAEAGPGDDAETRAYYVGAAATLLAGWSALVTAGIVVGARLPSSATLDVIAPLALLCLVVSQLSDAGARRAAAVAVAVALVGTSLPAGVPVLLAMAAGAAAGSTRQTTS